MKYFRQFRDRLEKIETEEIVRRINLGLLVLFVLTMPLVIYLKNTEYGYTKTIYMFVFISFMLILYALQLVISETARFSLTKLSYGLILVLMAGLLSIVNAGSAGVAIQSLAVFFYFILFYLLLVNTVKKRSELTALLTAALAAAFGALLYGFLQYFGLAPGGEEHSMISTMGNKNYLAGFISYLFLPGLALYITTRSKTIKIVAGIVLLSIFIILFPIGARGAWLGLIMGGLIYLGGLFVFRPLDTLTDNRVWLIALASLLIISFLLASAPGPWNSVLSLSAPNEEKGDGWGILAPVLKPLYTQLIQKGGARLEDWYIGWEMLKDHPITGIGLGNYKIKFGEYRSKLLKTARGEYFGGYIPRGAQAHNDYVQLAAETGIIGILSIAFFLGSFIWVGINRIKLAEGGENRLISLALFAGSICFLSHAAVSFPAHLPASSLNLAFFFGLLNSDVFGKKEVNISLKGFKATILGFLIVCFVVPVSVYAYRDWQANIYRGKGVKQMKFGNYRLAQGTLQKSLKLDFYPRQTYFYLGVVERELGREGKAIEYFEKCLGRFEPYKLYIQLGSLYLGKRKYARAEKYLKRFISMDPKVGERKEAKYFLARSALAKGNLQQGQGILREILKKDKNYQKAMILLGKIKKEQGKIQEAKSILEKAETTIQNKLEKVESQLGGSLSLDRYHELTSKKETLKKQKKAVEKALENLG